MIINTSRFSKAFRLSKNILDKFQSNQCGINSCNNSKQLLKKQIILSATRKMSQKSITSFFTKAPKKSLDFQEAKDKSLDKDGDIQPESNHSSKKALPKVKPGKNKIKVENDSSKDSTKAAQVKDKKSLPTLSSNRENDNDTPKKSRKAEKASNGKKSSRALSSSEESDNDTPKKTPKLEKTSNGKKSSRTLSSSEESDSDTPKRTPKAEETSSGKRKSLKRQRIDSSSNDDKSPKKENVPATVKPEKTTPKKTEASPNLNKKFKKHLDEKSNIKESVNKDKEDSKNNDEGSDDLESKVSENDYNPAKNKYHPIHDACWARGAKVPYLALAKTLEAIEATSARLKIVEILSNYYRSVMILTPEDLLPSVYLCLNQLAPAYHSLELGVADMYLMKAVAQSTGRTLAQVRASVKTSGDLGQVAQQARSAQRTMFQPPPLMLRAVFAALKEIAHMTGQASVNKKIAKIQTLYVACRQSEAKYLIRCLSGKLRVGLAEQSVLQALATATAASPPPLTWPPPAPALMLTSSCSDDFKSRVDANSLIIKTTYCECPNYERLVEALLTHGVHALPDHCRLEPGVPLKPMLAHPTKGVTEVFQRFENIEFTCEWKYDGERAQIHVPSKDGKADLASAKIFSRNQEDNTGKYPDILRRLSTLLADDVTSCVLDCEAVAYDTKTQQILPFQVLSTRKRKAVVEEEVTVQVCVFVFDVLYLNERPLVQEPLAKRRELLRAHCREVEGHWQMARGRDCASVDAVQDFLEEAVRGRCEGLMVKTLTGAHATYEIAKRSRNWLKLKKDYLEGVGDTLDVVVLGAYHGMGKRAGVYGGFLLACYLPDLEEFQSLCKLGTGFSDDDLQTLSAALREHVIPGPKPYYRFDTSHSPDVWFETAAVWEVRCADLSLSPAHHAAIGLLQPDKGVSLRFPRFVRVRPDKTPEQATTARQVADMYLAQDQVQNLAPSTTPNDDFY